MLIVERLFVASLDKFQNNENDKAGKWGDYKCDANPKIFNQLKQSFDSIGKPDIIMWTGDNPDHDFHITPETSTNATLEITELMMEYIPETPIFSIHGNHEFDPMSVQDFNLDIDPVIEIVANSWKDWLTEEAYEEYKTQSFYSMKAIDHPRGKAKDYGKKMEKTRIIAYNSQDCYIYNFYLIGQLKDPKQQFVWLENLLRQMEKDGEVAIFISHVSPGTSDCISEVSARLRVLMDRFQHIIRLNLFGHTHEEEFEVVRAVEDGKPIGVNHLAPSMTSFVDHNPAFRVITLDAETKLPIKIETHAFDLKRANEDDSKAEFKLHHELGKDYGLPDLSPQSFLDLTKRFIDDEAVTQKYHEYMYAGGPGFTPNAPCDDHCRRLLSCRCSNSVFSEARQCLQWNDYLNIWVLESYLFDFMNGKWVEKN